MFKKVKKPEKIKDVDIKIDSTGYCLSSVKFAVAVVALNIAIWCNR